MAIDRELYEKYSGRTHDPHAALGASLAARDRRRANEADSLRRFRYLSSPLYTRVFVSIFLAIAVLLAVLFL